MVQIVVGIYLALSFAIKQCSAGTLYLINIMAIASLTVDGVYYITYKRKILNPPCLRWSYREL
jgi:hypothetical protein